MIAHASMGLDAESPVATAVGEALLGIHVHLGAVVASPSLLAHAGPHHTPPVA